MRWLLIKDLQILRRSPLLVALLVIYPIAIALMIGFALSSPPGKPKVAILNQVPKGQGVIPIGAGKIDASRYASQLYSRVQPIKVSSRDQVISAVRSGKALAGVIIPPDITATLKNGGRPQLEVVLNVKDPLVKQYVDSTIQGELAKANQALSQAISTAAVSFLQAILQGGHFQGFGLDQQFLGLQNATEILQGLRSQLPAKNGSRAALAQVIAFQKLAGADFVFSNDAIDLVSSPIVIKRTELAGRTTSPERYAVTIAVIVSLMFVTVLLASGMLALEREENAFPRLVRGLVSRTELLVEKMSLSAGCAAAVTLLMLIGIAIFTGLSFGRLPLWIVALALGGLAFAALGVAIGGLTREVRAASLLSFLLSLPIAFLALVPKSAVSGALYTVLSAISAIFPFKPALQAMDSAINSTSGFGLALGHLVALTLIFGALGRVALRRFG